MVNSRQIQSKISEVNKVNSALDAEAVANKIEVQSKLDKIVFIVVITQ